MSILYKKYEHLSILKKKKTKKIAHFCKLSDFLISLATKIYFHKIRYKNQIFLYYS